MAVAVPATDEESASSASRPFTAVTVVGVASLGAGAIHAAAIGAHSEQDQVVLTFALTAAFQLAWGAGALAVRRARSWFLVLGAVGNGAALVGWLLAKTTGIAFISGMEEAESIQLADGVAAGMALVAGLLALRALLMAELPSAPLRRPLLAVSVLPIAALTLASMITTGSHSHAGGHAHGDEAAGGHDHGEPAAAPAPFDPEEEIDLSGVPGVTAEEQAEAEDLVRRSLDRLPQFADISTLNDKGFYSIGDGLTGQFEHYVNWSYVNDDKILDPDYPESLVITYDEDGDPALSAAMYMLPEGTTLDDTPDVGGPLIQWHVHNDLCLTDDPIAPKLALFSGVVVGAAEQCQPPNSKRGNVPMVHVWIVPHPCGPFAALEGIGGGQVKEGEEVLCTEEHAHVGES